jgi:hypothetical protein
MIPSTRWVLFQPAQLKDAGVGLVTEIRQARLEVVQSSRTKVSYPFEDFVELRKLPLLRARVDDPRESLSRSCHLRVQLHVQEVRIDFSSESKRNR